MIECPQCGKHTIVQHQETRYICLSCNWEKDVAEPDRTGKSSSGSFALPLWLATALIVLLML